MQKLKWLSFFIVVVVAMFICAVLIKLAAQRQDMEARGPLTVEEINRLAVKWGASSSEKPTKPLNSPKDQGEPSQARETQAGRPFHGAGNPPVEGDSSSPSLGSPPAIRPPLKKVLTQTERERYATLLRDYYQEKNKPGLINFIRPSLPTLMEFFTTAGLSAGLNRDGAGMHYWEAASFAFQATGDWETAKRLYMEALNYPLKEEFRQFAYARLAWMEDDPQVANRLLELACPPGEENRSVLYDAMVLANETGSTELRDYFAARLQSKHPSTVQVDMN